VNGGERLSSGVNMEQLTELFTLDMIISAMAVTFIVSALNTVQNKITTNWLVFIISIIVTVLRVNFEFPDWQNLIFQLLITMSFAILFYNYIGKWFVDNVFLWIKGRFTK